MYRSDANGATSMRTGVRKPASAAFKFDYANRAISDYTGSSGTCHTRPADKALAAIYGPKPIPVPTTSNYNLRLLINEEK